MVNQISRYVKIQYPLKIKKEFSSNFATVKYFDKIDLFDSWLKLGAGHYSCRVGVGGGGGERREKRRGGGQSYVRLAIGEGAKHFYK